MNEFNKKTENNQSINETPNKCIFKNNKTSLKESCKGDENSIKKTLSTPGSYKTPDNSVVGKDLYSNKLPKNLEYYRLVPTKGRVMNMKSSKNFNFKVGTYHHVIPINMFTLKELTIIDFMCLYGNQWISNFVIDLCLAIHAKNNHIDVRILYCNKVEELISNTEVHETLVNKLNFKKNCKVIMPWNINNSHWIIVFLDFKLKECVIMDPLNPTINHYNSEIINREYVLRFQRVGKALKKHCFYDDGPIPDLAWVQCKNSNVPTQLDSFNCGVYIIYYAMTMMDNTEFCFNFNPNTYRDYLKCVLLENSGDMTNICLYCQRHENKHKGKLIEWVSCTSCFRWVAIDCISIEYRLDDYNNSDFYCILCDKTCIKDPEF